MKPYAQNQMATASLKDDLVIIGIANRNIWKRPINANSIGGSTVSKTEVSFADYHTMRSS
jgi:hypothetical protein